MWPFFKKLNCSVKKVHIPKLLFVFLALAFCNILDDYCCFNIKNLNAKKIFWINRRVVSFKTLLFSSNYNVVSWNLELLCYISFKLFRFNDYLLFQDVATNSKTKLKFLSCLGINYVWVKCIQSFSILIKYKIFSN